MLPKAFWNQNNIKIKSALQKYMQYIFKCNREDSNLWPSASENYDKDAPFGAGKKHFQGAKREQQTV